jgi:uncharacterized protein YbbC (DUF1343 family)
MPRALKKSSMLGTLLRVIDTLFKALIQMLTGCVFVLYFIVLLGIDRLFDSRFKPVRGMKIGLLSNISCCDSHLVPTILRLAESKKLKLKALFAAEHGFYGALQDQVVAPDTSYGRRLKVYSLYGRKREPALKALEGLDAILIDLPDIGTRYYTFAWSAMLMIRAAAKQRKRIFVLDRPNPLNGVTIQGPLVEPGYESFVGLYSVPIRHGLTIGELCRMLNQEHSLAADVEVIKMRGWKRTAYGDELGLHWAVPSPNMPGFSTALVYPGMCLLEATNVSEGRGTTKPFEIFGAPWIEPYRLAQALQKSSLRGCAFRPTFFIPAFHKFQGRLCGGIQIYVTDRRQYAPVSAGLEITRTIRRLFPEHFCWRPPPYEYEKHRMPFDILIGNAWVRKAIEKNMPIHDIQEQWQSELDRFKVLRKKYLLYS